MPEESQETNQICKDCINWKQFGRKCHFFWEKKKECPSKIQEGDEEPMFSNLDQEL